MNNPLKQIKEKIEADTKQKAEEQKQREDRLIELEALNNQGGFHPIKTAKNNKEIKELKREINVYNEKQKNKKFIFFAIVVFIVLFVIIGIMAIFEKDSSQETFNETSIHTTVESPVTVITQVSESEINQEFNATKPTITQTGVTEIKEKSTVKQVEKRTEKITDKHENNQGDNNSVIVPSKSETDGNLVWVPTNGGTKYHTHSGCSNMEDPIQVSIETAKRNGYEACGRCH